MRRRPPLVWHFDLYPPRRGRRKPGSSASRTRSADGISLIEWPERLGDAAAARAARHRILAFGARRRCARGDRSRRRSGWAARLARNSAMAERADAIAAFLAAAGWGDATPPRRSRAMPRSAAMSGSRRDAARAMLMDAPPPKEDVRPFIAVARLLARAWASARRAILAEDVGSGPAADRGFRRRHLYAAPRRGRGRGGALRARGRSAWSRSTSASRRRARRPSAAL